MNSRCCVHCEERAKKSGGGGGGDALSDLPVSLVGTMVAEPATYCVSTCTVPTDCASPELGCVLASSMGTDRICWPACQTTADCQDGYMCDVAPGDGYGDCVRM